MLNSKQRYKVHVHEPKIRREQLGRTISVMLAADVTDNLSANRFKQLYNSLKTDKEKKLFISYVEGILK